MRSIKKDHNYRTWVRLLKFEWDDFIQYGPEGRFSSGENKDARWFGKHISKFSGKILDIGCGVIPLPVYMTYTKNAQWYGIDPLGEDIERQFEFKSGVAEDIPYKDQFFDVVVFATSFDHICNINKAVSEVYRVLKPNGFVVIWIGLIKPRKKTKWDQYLKWASKGFNGQYNERHLWGFTEQMISKHFRKFKRTEVISGKQDILVFQKVS